MPDVSPVATGVYNNSFAYDFAETGSQISRAYDDALIAKNGLSRSDFNFQIGDAQIRQGQLFFNAEYPFSDHFTLYSFGGFSVKEGKGYGFRRLPSETFNVVPSLYPNGFQAVVGSRIYDVSYAVGAKYAVNNWLIDLSNTLGSNTFNYNISNTNNASLGAKSPTRFYAGRMNFFRIPLILMFLKALTILTLPLEVNSDSSNTR